MDAFIDTLIQLLIDWGYAGLFISALLAGSIIPFSSELVMLALVKVGLNPAICVLAATLGNTMGGMTCYYMGHLGKTDWIEKYFKVKQEKIDKMQRFLQGKGALIGFLCLSAIYRRSHCIALGFMLQQRNADFPFHVYRKTDTVHRYVIGSSRRFVGDECLAVGN